MWDFKQNPSMSHTDNELTIQEIQNLSKTLETYRAQILEEVRMHANGRPSDSTMIKLKKAYKLKQEEDFNKQFQKP
jgi:hypothetical protein